MPPPRARNDGLPARVYERFGVRSYSIGHKSAAGTWTFRLRCPVTDRGKIAELRREATHRAADLNAGPSIDGTFAALCDAWLARQLALPENSESRRADSTLAENERELANLKLAFGHMRLRDMTRADAYAYLDACLVACAPDGTPRPRPAKGNKEISLARTVLEYGVRLRAIDANPFDAVEKLKTRKAARWVTDDELDLAVRVGRQMGGPQHIVALALRTAWLCVKRSVEVRALTRDQFRPDGILWTSAKRQAGQDERTGLIRWSDDLRSTVDEALAVPRNKLAGTWYVFGNLNGQRYTKGGWKATLRRLMDECVREAARERVAFSPFSLQDCRPKGVSDKLSTGQGDVVDATLHSNERMVRSTYDRRRVRAANPVK